MKVPTPLPAFIFLIFFPWALGLAAEDPNVGADPLMHEAVALTERAEQPASPVEALLPYSAAPARLQEMVRQFPLSRAAVRLVPGDPLALRLDAAMAETQPLAQQETSVAGERRVASDACAYRFEHIRRGETRCGIGLGEDDRIYLDGRAIGGPIMS